MKPHQAGQAWLDAVPDPLIAIDGDGRLEWANRAAVSFFGWALPDFIDHQVLDLVHPDDLHFALMSLESVQSKEIGTPIEVRVRTSRGWRLVEVVGSNRLGATGVDTILLSLRDLTERRRWEVGHGDDAVFRAVVHNAASLLMLVANDGTIQSISGAVTRLLGLDPEGLEGTSLYDLVLTEDRKSFRRAMNSSQSAPAGDTEPVTVEAALLDSGGQAVPFELTLVDMSDDPTVDGLVVSAHNITKLRAFQRALADLARRDPLTMLANRAAVDDRLESLLGRRERAVVAFVDLDGFKAINDRYGHHFGDLVLRQVATRLEHTVRPGDLVARYGGDEFVVVATGVDCESGLGDRLAAALAQTVLVDGVEVSVNASVGLAGTVPGDTVTSLLIRADRAMYDLKAGRAARAS